MKEVIELDICTDTTLGVEKLAICAVLGQVVAKNPYLFCTIWRNTWHKRKYLIVVFVTVRAHCNSRMLLATMHHMTTAKPWRQDWSYSKLDFYSFSDFSPQEMRLNCEVVIINRLAPSANIRNTTKPARASLAIGRKESTKSSDGTAAKTVFLLVCTAKERTGTKYKVCVKECLVDQCWNYGLFHFER